jgi:hypothetical protein
VYHVLFCYIYYATSKIYENFRGTREEFQRFELVGCPSAELSDPSQPLSRSQVPPLRSNGWDLFQLARVIRRWAAPLKSGLTDKADLFKTQLVAPINHLSRIALTLLTYARS